MALPDFSTDLSMTQPSKTTVIAIAGASASGKSLFAETIYQELLPELGPNGISIIKEDAYYRDQSHLSIDERIFLWEFDYLVQCIRSLQFYAFLLWTTL